MKQYLLSIIGALLVLAGASTLEARAQALNETQNEAQNGVAAQPRPQPQPQVQAQARMRPVCGQRSTFVSQLKDRFAEKPVSVGLASNGVIVEVFAANSGSFSILVTRPEGISCLVTSGENWQDLPTRKADMKI